MHSLVLLAVSKYLGVMNKNGVRVRIVGDRTDSLGNFKLKPLAAGVMRASFLLTLTEHREREAGN